MNNRLQKAEKSNKLKPSSFSQLKRIFLFLSKKERITVYCLLIIMAGSLISWGVMFYLEHTKVVPRHGGIFTEGIVGSLKYINPLLAPANDVDMDISRMVYSSLLKSGKNGELINDLAEKYNISDDKITYLFYIKKNAKWHDGKTLTADDVVFTVKAIQNPEYKSPLSQSFSGVVVDKQDDYTVKFTLKEPYTPFLSNMTFGIMPKHIWENILPKNAHLVEYNLKPIGSGPYKFDKLKKDKSGEVTYYELKAFKDYYNGKPYIEKIIFKFYKDLDSLYKAFKDKKIINLSYITPDKKEEIEKEQRDKIYQFRLPTYFAIFFNQDKSEILRDKSVRIGLAHAINKKEVIDKVFYGQAITVNSPILPGFLGYDKNVKEYKFDKRSAIESFKNAGWKKEKKKGYLKKDGKILEFTLITSNLPEHKKTAKILEEQLKTVGVKLNIESYDIAKLQQDYILSRNYESLLFGEILRNDPDPYPFWHSSQKHDPGLNLAMFENENADKLIEEARKETNKKERKKKYKDFQNILAEELPAIFLYSPTYLYGADKHIKGIETKAVILPSDRFSEVNEWYIKTQRVWKNKK